MTIKTLLKSTFFTLLLLVVAGALTALWLRFEFARVKASPDALASWYQVAVTPLEPDNRNAAPCADQYPHRKAFFGALHVHTAASYDSSAFDVTTTADEAYRFARGEALPLRLSSDPPDFTPPTVRIRSPLDFMAVTDHAEALGENRLCYAPDSPAHDTLVCKLFRGDLRLPVEEH